MKGGEGERWMIGFETTINGRRFRDVIEPRTLLADYLRDGLGLTGTKVSCDQEVCGACTVLVDDLPVSACTTLAIEADGRRILTIEGLAGPEGLHPIQQAFVESSALQCGFCTPGMIMSLKALVERPSPLTRDEVRRGLEGNLCRCGTYPAVLEVIDRLLGGAHE